MNYAAFVTLALLITLWSPLIAQTGALQRQGAGGRSAKPRVAATAVATEVINLNSATAAQIATLPGIGLKTADLVVQYRTKNGPFKKIEEIMNVRGIGEKSFLKIKDRLSVAEAKK